MRDGIDCMAQDLLEDFESVDIGGLAGGDVGQLDGDRAVERWHHLAMLSTLRAMPGGVRIFLGYAFLVLGLIGVSLRWVVDQAISAPISGPGIVVMVLLAYTIFTTTLVLQRKEASRNLALGLSTLTVPAVPLGLLAAQPLFALITGILAVLLFFGLTRPEVRTWLNEP